MTSTSAPELDPATAPGSAAAGSPSGSTLPPTGIQQQVNTINQQVGSYGQAALQQIGQGGQPATSQISPAMLGQQGQQPIGTTNLNNLAKSLAQQYGLAVGKDPIVDQFGNLTMDPEKVSREQGIGLQQVAQKMNYMAQSLADYQNKQAQQKGISALQAGMGQVRSRGRGSLAAMQSGFYQQMAAAYTDPNMLTQAQDFSFYIQQENWRREMAFQESALRSQKKKSKFGAIGAIGGGILGGILGGGSPAGIQAGASTGGALGGLFG